jgi:hypothetical protein
MTNSEVLNNQITLQAIANSLDNITRSLSGFATKEDLKNFATKDDLKNFATKDDLKNFATKDDLKNFATKDDLKNFATKDDLKNFATKDDLLQMSNRLEDLIDSLAISTLNAITKINTRLDALEEKVDRNHMYAVNQFDHIMVHFARREEYQYYGERLNKLERKVFA